jgi:hypothetical protein
MKNLNKVKNYEQGLTIYDFRSKLKTQVNE